MSLAQGGLIMIKGIMAMGIIALSADSPLDGREEGLYT